MASHYQKTYFLLSVADVKQLPPDEGIEVAIVGRSNSGKSSTLNAIVGKKGLARVSKTPGRTQMINLFVVAEGKRLADLPGYGYAQATPVARRKWQNTISNYFADRHCLRGLILVMDIRHPLKPLDLQMLELSQATLPIHILLNKSDKLSKQAAQKTLRETQAALADFGHLVTVQCFSAQTSTGLKELHQRLNEWYGF